MDWLKKFLQWFKDDDTNDDINTSSHKNSTRQINEGFNNKNGDVEARIYYQYPKGKFRFPVIPDEKERPSRNPVNREGTAEKRSGHNSRGRKDKMQSAKPQAKAEPDHQRKNDYYSGRPFKPTEIPSPIYGFEQRKRASKPVEFEMDDFAQEPLKEHDIPQSDASPLVRVEPEPEPALEPTLELEPALEQEPELTLEPEPALDLTVELEPTIKPELEPTFEPEPASELTVEPKPSNEPELELTLEPESALKPEPALTEVENDDISESAETNNINPLPVQQDVSEIQAQPQSEQSEKTEKGIVNKEHTLKSQEHNKNRREGDRPHIPFNVIMLSHDKKKLAERGRAEKERTSSAQRSISPERAGVLKETAAAIEEKPSVPTDKGNVTDAEPYYVFPSMGLLKPPVSQHVNKEWLEEQKELLNETLKNFNVRARVVNMTQGPSVTRFEVQPEPGVKVNKITNLSDDIKLSLAAKDIRIEAPIPGKHTIGIEVPNQSRRPVFISEIIGSPAFTENASPLAAVLGLDISGKPIVTDLRKMPHGLIAGATGSGKSVCINSILVSLLYKANPADVKLLLIDPKMVELAPYNQIPHLVSPVITDVKAATAALKWAVEEMEHRYELFAHMGVRDITRYNDVVLKEERFSEKLPYIVIIIDELADLMMVSPADVEEAICRIAQKARACGIHLIIATQRPSVDVITGLIKANVPTRVAFSVSSQVDSRTIIDIGGAERLLGKGDMLFLENGTSKPVRLQGTFVTDEEIDGVVAHVRREQSPKYLFQQEELLKKELVAEEEDELFYEACEYIIQSGGASTSSLQRRFKIGYNRAARLIDMMETQGFISESKGSKPRDVLITESELESIKGEDVTQ